jgi:hypothetical protein
MLIRVKYSDNRYDYVKEDTLNRLIEANNIERFRRSSGWVTIGVDSLRKAKREYTYLYPNELKRRTL